MPDIRLTAETGRPLGSRAAKRLRASGKVPAVVYGHGTQPVPIAVDGRSLRSALTGESGLNALLELDLEGRPQLAMAKYIQRHPVRGTVAHVDFLLVNRDEQVTADVPITLVGDAAAVRSAGGVVDQELTHLSVTSAADRIPNTVEIDVSGFRVGDSVRVADLALPDGVVTDVDPDQIVVVAQGQQVSDADLVPEGAEAKPGEPGEAPEDAGPEGRAQEQEADAAAASKPADESVPTDKGGE